MNKKLLFAIVAVILVSFLNIVPAHAATGVNPDSLKDIISDSRPSTVAIHDIYLDQSSGASFGPGGILLISFPSGFTGVSAIVAADIVLFMNGATNDTANVVDAANCTGHDGKIVYAFVSGQQIKLTACNASTAGSAGTILEIKVGGTHKVTNTTAGTATLTLDPSTGSNAGDNSYTTIIDVIATNTATITYAELLTFSVGAISLGSCDITATGNPQITTTPTTVPFGTISSLNTFYDGCQSLTTGTNAKQGYTTTVQTTAAFTSGGNTIAKGSCDGACNDSTAAAWATASGHAGYGYCMKDTTNTAANTADSTAWSAAKQCGGGSQSFETIANAGASQTARLIMKQTTATSNSDISHIGYRLTVSGTQAAGSYTTIAVYICTPIFP